MLLGVVLGSCAGSAPATDITPPAAGLAVEPPALSEVRPTPAGVPSETPAVGLGEATEDEAPVELSPAPDEFTVIAIHPAQGALLEQLADQARRAGEADRHPYVEFYADWCPPCRALEASLGDSSMVEAFSGTYIIRLDYEEWKNRLAGTGLKVFGIPAFFELDADGSPTGRTITGAAWGEDVPANMAPPLHAFFQETGE